MAEFKKLFNEQCNAPVDCNVLEESVGNIKKQHMYISGPFLQAEDRNRNGRIYPQKIIEREVKLFNQLIESHEALGRSRPAVPSPGNIPVACSRATTRWVSSTVWL